MSVNLSPKQFRRRDLVDRVWSIVEQTDIVASSLRLDVTEKMLGREPEEALAKLSELKALGIGIHVDDFGTGPLSLGHLHRLPSPTIKIDRSFVSGLETPGPGVEVIRALVTLAQALGMTVSAEGLETEQQVTAFRDLACDYGQGHYFSHALDAARARELVRGERAVTPG